MSNLDQSSRIPYNNLAVRQFNQVLKVGGEVAATIAGGAVLKFAIESEAYLPAMGGAAMILGGGVAVMDALFPNDMITVTTADQIAQNTQTTVETPSDI